MKVVMDVAKGRVHFLHRSTDFCQKFKRSRNARIHCVCVESLFAFAFHIFLKRVDKSAFRI